MEDQAESDRRLSELETSLRQQDGKCCDRNTCSGFTPDL